ncbi:MAG: dienelactone hydrolase family protein [Spirulinaceae cyanobacterium SM2_1_0]|nr:dienelactone hydrolase family protein [Spirulinaceae cyanobacterium SM2_1_0]
MSSQTITITATDGGRFSAYLATPDAGYAPGVVLLQEIFGVNGLMRALADGYALAGFHVLVPDLFWRQQPGIELDDHDAADLERAFALYQAFDETQGVQDAIAALKALRQLPHCTRVGTVGFCLGGKLAYLMAARADAHCNVSYYGVGIEQNLTELAQIKAPYLAHIAEADEFVPPAAQAQLIAAFDPYPITTVHTYPGVNHAFARPGGAAFNAEMAGLANQRTMEFLQRHLH